MARAMGTNAYGKEPRRGERTLSRGFTHRRARRAFLRPYGAGASLGRSHRAYALGYFLVPLTGLRTAHAQDWPDAKNSASRRRRELNRAYALGYSLVPLTGLRTAHAQDWPDAKNSASRRRRGLKM